MVLGFAQPSPAHGEGVGRGQRGPHTPREQRTKLHGTRKDNKPQEEEDRKREVQTEPKKHKSAINSPLWTTGKGTTIKHQQINPCAS